MASRAQNLTITDTNFTGAIQPLQQLQAVQRPQGEADTTLYGVATKLEDQIGKYADEAATIEGKKAGAIAGDNPAFRPTDSTTLRGRAYDKAGSDVYISKLTSQFSSDAMDVFAANKDNPDGLKAGLAALQTNYQQQHVFPEVKGYFDAKAMDIGATLRMRALTNFEDNKKDQNRAALVTDMAAADQSRQRMLALNPNAPEAEREAYRVRDENIARINASKDAGVIPATAAAKMVLDEGDKAHSTIIMARAATLGSGDAIDAYRAKVKKDFVDKKMPGLQDFDTLDANLAKLSKARRVEGDTALRGLNTKIDDFVTRFGQGLTPSSAEWLSLEAEGQKLGVDGAAAVDAARSKLRIRTQINTLPMAEAEKFVRGLETNAAGGRGAIVDPSGRADPANFKAIAPDVQQRAKQLAGMMGQNLIITPHGGTQADRRASTSQHHDQDGEGGRALDLSIQGMSDADRTRLVANAVAAGAQGLGAYSVGSGVGTIHVDWRKTKGKEPDGLAIWHRMESGDEGLDTAPKWFQDGVAQGRAMRQSGKVPGAATGIAPGSAAILQDARAALEARRSLIAQDPLLAANREGAIPAIAPVDFTGKPDQLAGQLSARVAQSEAVGAAYQRPATYIRPDEREAVKAVMNGGGDKALDLLTGVIRGAGPRAVNVIKEMGGDAPALAHAGLLMMSTGDNAFARQVAEAQRARSVDGAKVPTPLADDVNSVMRTVLGTSLNGMDASERERTKAAAVAWAEQEFARRNKDPKADATPILTEAFQRARGMTGHGENTYGGLVALDLGAPGKFWGRESVPVQVPAQIKTSKFGDVLGAITDKDLADMANPPMAPGGRVLTANELRRTQPIFGPGGYRWGQVDSATGVLTPVAGKDGKPFLLDLNAMAPALRQRRPDAFR